MKMNPAWTDRPKEDYKWIPSPRPPLLVVLMDPATQAPSSYVDRMEEILHESWDKVVRKYADSPEPDSMALSLATLQGIMLWTTRAARWSLRCSVRKQSSQANFKTFLGIWWGL